MTQLVDSDVVHRDQALRDNDLLHKANGVKNAGVQQVGGATKSAGLLGSKAKAAVPKGDQKKVTSSAGHAKQGRGQAFLFMALAAVLVAFIGSLGPLFKPELYDEDTTGISRVLKDWSPLPQAGLAALLLALIIAVVMLGRPKKSAIPAGVKVGPDGMLYDEATGKPLPRGFKLVGKDIVVASTGAKLPKALKLGAGGVLLHGASGRPVPHNCALGPDGGLLSCDGKPLPDSMAVGPNSCLVAADGTVLSPDLQPVPQGFVLSSDKRNMLRPNGKPVPRGVHVGPGFRLLKPTGELMPDGVKIGPCGTIICLDGTILGSDGAPLPRGFNLSPNKTEILDPSGQAIDADMSIGPNCTLIQPKDRLVTILGRQVLPAKKFTLGPLGNLLHNGLPVPAAAAFNSKGQLIAGDQKTVLYSP